MNNFTKNVSGIFSENFTEDFTDDFHYRFPRQRNLFSRFFHCAKLLGLARVTRRQGATETLESACSWVLLWPGVVVSLCQDGLPCLAFCFLFSFFYRIGSGFPDREYARAGGPELWGALPWLGNYGLMSASSPFSSTPVRRPRRLTASHARRRGGGEVPRA